MEFVPILAMAAISLKIVDFFRYARAGDSTGVLTQIVAWVVGFVIVLLAAQTDWADGIAVGDMSLATLNIWSLLFVGLAAGSGASFFKDAYKAIDPTNSAAIPVLVPERARHREAPAGPTTREVG